MDTKLSVPASILLGCGLIAAALYFGLRHGPSSTASAPAVVASPAPPAPPALTAAATASEPPPSALAAIRAAMLAEKERVFKPKCWQPAIAKAPEPARSSYSISTSFDATGKEVMRGVSELRDVPSRPDVAQCLRGLPMGLTIPAPGQAVTTEVSIEFP
jgi:hypothetical protein